MGRGPDKQPRKQRALTWTAPIFVTENEAVKMGASLPEVRALESVGFYTHGGAPVDLYRYTDVEKSITGRGQEVNVTYLKENPIG